MAPLQKTSPSVVVQTFKSMNSTPLTSLPTLICTESSERYVLWSKVQDTFKGVNHLLDWTKELILFTIDNNGEL